jgi:hypothetical protein
LAQAMERAEAEVPNFELRYAQEAH